MIRFRTTCRHGFRHSCLRRFLRRPTVAPTRTCEYDWGADRSGTEQGAGGVEGLLAVSVDGTFYFPLYGDNSNIVGYVSETGTLAAQYVYDPYGNITETYGSSPDLFAFGFSTKYHDRELGLIAYQCRFYVPEQGRWLNRDPIEEEGGNSLYAACFNNLIFVYDSLGLWTATSESRGDKRRVNRRSRNDGIKALSVELGMDEETFAKWARVEHGPKASLEHSALAESSQQSTLKSGCYFSVPNVWIEADLLRGGSLYNRVFVNPGGAIGSFFGQTLGRCGYYTIKPKTPRELLKVIAS